MDDSYTSGSFGEMSDGFSKFHDYKQLPYRGAGYSILFTVISGERKLTRSLNSFMATSILLGVSVGVRMPRWDHASSWNMWMARL